MEPKTRRGGTHLTVEQTAKKVRKHPETERRMLRSGKLAGETIGGERKSSVPNSSLVGEPPAPAPHELRRISDWGLFPKGIPDQVVREMLRGGFFRKPIVLYELDRAEAVARQILADAKKSRNMDASLIAEAKRILSIRKGSPGD